ncbi:uncharacterized protein SAPINGB_P003795 [Magnusiomyces paraingens]|uniref:PX domain-containing protein n=1 Tax=Magnusiomyces paraingens TaxID=2606893 RepID=A0A5E8BWK8_9ASCO|nr:uncharacterized protein SAPINGB_P003795 [Saprochaete ingens]VVT53877.1 unnamed protein product [Saprochaete ingens]
MTSNYPSSLQQPSGPPPLPPLKAIHEHYLKRELIRIQLAHELRTLADLRLFGLLGPPLDPPDPSLDLPEDPSVPIMQHVFQHHILTFPFISAGLDHKGMPTTIEFWRDTVQKFFEILGAEDLSSSEDREEATKRRKISNKLTTLVSIYMASGLQTTNPDEKTSKISGSATRSAMAPGSGKHAHHNGAAVAKSGIQNIDAAALARELLDAPNFINGFDVNVVGVRIVKNKKKSPLGNFGGALGNLFQVPDDHAEFIIRARMAHPDHDHSEADDSKYNADLLKNTPVIYVSRRFSDFVSLGNRLAKELVGIELPNLPSKNKSSLNLDGEEKAADEKDNIPKSPSQENHFEDEDEDEDEYDDHSQDHVQESQQQQQQQQPQHNLSKGLGNLNLQFKKLQFSNITNIVPGIASSINNNNTPHAPPKIKLPRERQRLSVRAYLRDLLTVPAVSKSQTFMEFLFRDQLRGLSSEEQDDIDRRRAMDTKRVEDQLEFLRLATARARELETHMADFKHDMMQPDGLQRIFAELREKDHIEQLSPRFQTFLQWAAVEFSASLYSMFVSGDHSASLFSQVSRIHRLMPYSVLRGILRYSNPVAIMKGVIDLFLAQPFGKRSLLQNIFYLVLADDIKAQDKQISILRKGLCADPRHAEVVENILSAYLSASPSVRREIRASTHNEDHSELILAIFKHSRMLNPDGGVIQDEVSLLVEAWYEAWNSAVERNNSDAPGVFGSAAKYPDEYVASYTTTRELLKHMMRRSDKNKLQDLWNETTTMSLLRDLFTIFYSPLIDVFKSAKVYEAVADLENFMNDLIKVVQRAEASVLTRGPNEMVDEFIALCNRHLPSLFRFVHDMYINDKGLFFDGLLKWLTDIVQFLRYGTTVEGQEPSRIDLNAILELAAAQHGVDPLKVRAEMDSLVEWLEARRAWIAEQSQQAQQLAKQAGVVGSIESKGLNWNEALPTSGDFDSSTFGIAQDEFDAFDDLNEEDTLNADQEEATAELRDTNAQVSAIAAARSKSPKARRAPSWKVHRKTGSDMSQISVSSHGSGSTDGVVVDTSVGVEAERARRERLLKRLQLQREMPKRPLITETPKLRETFALALKHSLS